MILFKFISFLIPNVYLDVCTTTFAISRHLLTPELPSRLKVFVLLLYSRTIHRNVLKTTTILLHAARQQPSIMSLHTLSVERRKMTSVR